MEIPEEEPPVDIPGDDVIILDEGVPLAVMAAISALSGAGLFLTRKKREDEE